MTTPPSNGSVTSPYGMRWHPVSGEWRMHWGEDRIGSGNVAPVSGIITFAGWHSKSGFGNCVSIRADSDGAVWTVAHHAYLEPLHVGNWIAEGTRTGQIGMTGVASGIHTHTERRTGSNGQPLSGTATNPALYYVSGGGGGGNVPEPTESETPVKFFFGYTPDGGQRRFTVIDLETNRYMQSFSETTGTNWSKIVGLTAREVSYADVTNAMNFCKVMTGNEPVNALA